MADRYYFSLVYEVVAETDEEAWEILNASRMDLADDRVRYLDGASGLDGMEEGTDEDAEHCICSPELLARGGFKGGCPVHGTAGVGA